MYNIDEDRYRVNTIPLVKASAIRLCTTSILPWYLSDLLATLCTRYTAYSTTPRLNELHIYTIIVWLYIIIIVLVYYVRIIRSRANFVSSAWILFIMQLYFHNTHTYVLHDWCIYTYIRTILYVRVRCIPTRVLFNFFHHRR